MLESRLALKLLQRYDPSWEIATAAGQSPIAGLRHRMSVWLKHGTADCHILA